MYYYRTPRKKKKKRAGKWFGLILTAFLILFLVLIIKTYTYPFAKIEKNGETLSFTYEFAEGTLERLSNGIRIPTISSSVNMSVNNPFDEFKGYLRDTFPELHSVMDTLTVNKYGLLYCWKGKDATKNPILFTAHYDVVPVVGFNPETDTPEERIIRPEDTPESAIAEFRTKWDYPPFSGAIADGRVYGRGTLDDKGMLFAQLEAVDYLVKQGFQPEQDIWFAYGFDEETGGTEGAEKIAEYFRGQNITFDAVYDEGGIIIAPGQGGIRKPVGLVGVAEKGYCSVRITVRGLGGHASMPSKNESLVYAAEIINKLNKNRMPLTLVPPISDFLDRAGGTMGFFSRMAIANKWLLEGVLMHTLSNSPSANALVRTTTAVTMAKGSDVPNVLPPAAEITVNFRILTGETVQMVLDHVKDVCQGYDTDIETVEASREPSRLSSDDTGAFRAIVNAASKVYPEVLITPYITVEATDAYKYESVSKNVYRFMPVYLNEYEQRTIHNENEYISLENYKKMIAFFIDMMKEYENTK